jgi:hypothetical protein
MQQVEYPVQFSIDYRGVNCARALRMCVLVAASSETGLESTPKVETRVQIPLGLPGKAQVRPPVESESRVSWAGRPAFVPRTTATCHGRTCPRVGNRVAPWCRTSRGTLEESAAPLVWVARVGSAAMSAGRGGWGTQARSLSLAPALRTAIGRVTVAFTRPACRGP